MYEVILMRGNRVELPDFMLEVLFLRYELYGCSILDPVSARLIMKHVVYIRHWRGMLATISFCGVVVILSPVFATLSLTCILSKTWQARLHPSQLAWKCL